MNHAFENILETWNNKSKQVTKKIDDSDRRLSV